MRVNITIPVFNEESRLADTIQRLHAFLMNHPGMDWEIVIANNGSTDGSLDVARELSKSCPELRVVHLDQKGRGGALKKAWLESEADLLSYMDADLSTDLEAFPKLIGALTQDGYDMAIGSRLLKASEITRSFKRELISRCYNGLVKTMLGTRFSDTQCGFKAIKREPARKLLPMIQDEGWFFDTELLVTAERLGYRIFEVPVRWVEGRHSHVNLLRTAIDDFRGLRRLRRKFAGKS
jgi:glycosyltransferase involved in cell wall biosynthesis